MFFAAGLRGQASYNIIQEDTTVETGAPITLCIDSTKAYSNFIFSALDQQTMLWTIWKKNSNSGKYEPIYTDRYNRMNVAASADKTEMIYVRYKPQQPGGMYNAIMDSAWVCRSSINGKNETILFQVAAFNKNAIYDLDWSADKERVLYAYGNDQYPNLTRDGDIYEYNIKEGVTYNLTNNWELWSRYCRYSPDGKQYAYSHFANFWFALPTDVFIKQKNGSAEQSTNSVQFTGNDQFCTLTDFTGDKILYRRGLYADNKLYRKSGMEEQLLFSIPGYGGVQLTKNLYAATDLANNIYLFTNKKTIGSIRISAIKSFAKDNAYNFAMDCNTRLNWLGKQKIKVKWSTGDTGYAITVQPKRNTTYYCTLNANDNVYIDSIHIKVRGAKPLINKTCLTLSTSHNKNYQWLLNSTPISGATDSTYTPEGPGSFAVTITDKKGSTATSQEIIVSETEADSVKMLNEQIKITPDPSTSIIYISAPFPLNMVIVNESGKIIDKQKDVHQTSLNNLPDGVYNIMLYDNYCLKLKTRRIVKKSD